jgi:hypothetical protein
MKSSNIQSVLIPKSKMHSVNFPKIGFTLKQSHKWLLKHNFKIPKKVDETINFYRYRQRLPDKRYTYTTKVLPNGVELVLMWKKPNNINIGGVKRQIYTPEPDKELTQTQFNNAIISFKPWKVFQLKELIQKYNEDKNLNIKYKVARRNDLIKTIIKFNINPNEYEISQVNPKQPIPTNVLRKYGLKPNTDDEQRRYEEELGIVPNPLLARTNYTNKEGLLEKIVLQEHQEKFIKQFIFSNLRGAIVFHGVGTGKTLTAVVASFFYLVMYPKNKVIVISPSALLYNFINGMQQFGLNLTDNRYKFLTYEKYIRSQTSKTPIKTKDSLLIIDEAHNFRTEIIKVEIRDPETDDVIGYDTIKNKRGQTVLSRGAIYAHKVLLLTGTPFVNTIYDIENLLSMIEKRDPLQKEQFFNMLSIPDNIPDYFNYKISYQPIIDSSFFPKMNSIIEGIYMTEEQEKEYNKIKEVGKFEIDEEGEMVFTGKDSEKPNAYYSAERYATNAIGKENNPKINRILELVEEKPNQKFIIYTALQDAGIKLLEKKLSSKNIFYKVISGSQSTTQKEESRRYFNGFYSSEIPKDTDSKNKDYINDKYRVLLITKAGTEGVDTINCHNLILLDHQWNDSTTQQIIARAIRFKSHFALPVSERYVNVYTLLFCFKKEQRFIKRLNEKGFNDYIGMKNETTAESQEYSRLKTTLDLSFIKFGRLSEKYKLIRFEKKTEEQMTKELYIDYDKITKFLILSFPNLKDELLKIYKSIDGDFNYLKSHQNILDRKINIGRTKKERTEYSFNVYVIKFIIPQVNERYISLLKKKVDYGELDIKNLDPSIDLKLFLLAKSKQKNINEFVSKIGNDISKFETYETKLLPLITQEELKLKRPLTDEEQIDIYRKELKDEIQETLKNKFVPALDTIGKRRLTQDQKQQFYTGLELAKEIVDLALEGLEGTINILEPTAGNGGLIQPFIKNIIKNKDVIFSIDLIEIDEKNRNDLKKLVKQAPNILNLLDNKNFLTFIKKQYYDLILMNPPFHLNGKENGLIRDTYDWEFMRRAFGCLKVGGSIICICSTSWSFGTQHQRFIEEFPILKIKDGNYYSDNLKDGKTINSNTQYCKYTIIRKQSKFKGSEGKDTSSEMSIDIFKLTKLDTVLDNTIFNTIFYRSLSNEALKLENNNIDLDNKLPEPPLPKPAPIVPEVILPEPIKVPKNTFELFSKRLNALASIGSTGEIGYVPAEYVSTFSYAYLMDKYKSSCPIFKTYKEINTSSIIKTGITYANKSIEAPEGLGSYFKNCIDRGEDLIVFPLMLPRHANLMIFRPYQKIIERYEPHGSEYGGDSTSDELLNKVLRKYFEETLKPDLKEFTPRFKTPLQICPLGFTKGLQSIEGLSKLIKKIDGDGYCQIWSLFLLETILLNPKSSTQDIIKNIYDISKSEPDYLLNLIRGYVSILSINIKELSDKLGSEFRNLSIRNKSIYGSLATLDRKKIFNDYLTKLVDNSLLRIKQKPELIPENLVENSNEKLMKELQTEIKTLSNDELQYLYYYLWKNIIATKQPNYGDSQIPRIKKYIIKELSNLGMTLKEYSNKNKWIPKMGLGGNLDLNELAQFVDAGYKTKSEVQNVDGYVLDKELSTKRDKVYYDPNTGKAVHTIAGTDNTKDWSNNLLIPLGLHQYSNRYKNAEKIQKKANEKYGKENLSLVSHSQSGNIADNLAKKKLVGDENITLNPAIIGSHNKNLKVVKSSGDIVSALTFTNKKDKVLKSKTWNPLYNHSTQILNKKSKK